MTSADRQYLDLVKKIIKYGTMAPTRAKWEDGTVAYAKKLFGESYTFNLQEEFPILTTKQVFFKTAVKELIWIWVMGSNKVSDLRDMGVKIWNEWELPDGTIGKAYGQQARHLEKHMFDAHTGEYLGIQEIDQVKVLIEGLKNDPQSRRHIVSFWNVADLDQMSLQPCAFQTIWDVTDGYLNCQLVQRSSDIFLGNPFNFTQYAVLMHMIAQVTGYKPGKLYHTMTNAHIYDRHINLLEEQLEREPTEAPKIWINPEVKDFNDFKPEDIKLIDYKSHPAIKGEVSI